VTPRLSPVRLSINHDSLSFFSSIILAGAGTNEPSKFGVIVIVYTRRAEADVETAIAVYVYGCTSRTQPYKHSITQHRTVTVPSTIPSAGHT
jgi:hypothetical protein